MAASLQLSRNTHVFLEYSSNIWKLPVLDGYSFSQSTATTEVTINEMTNSDNDSRRGRALFTNAVNPAEWSFSLYVRPSGDTAVEDALWALMCNGQKQGPSGTKVDLEYTPASNAWGDGVTRGSNQVAYDFENSNQVTLPTFDLYFVLGACGPTGSADYSPANGQTIYKIKDCVINSAEISFDIDGIAMITWSGFGNVISEVAAYDASAAITTGIGTTSNFIRNRLTTLSVIPDTNADATTAEGDQDSDATTGNAGGTAGNEFQSTYSVVLTGGSISIENNISFLTPEELCKVNQPIGHVAGTRTISGNFTCYLNDSAGSSADLFTDLIDATNITTNHFNLNFSVGGGSGVRAGFNIKNAHIEIPTHSIEDVISLTTNFHALPTSISNSDEVVVTYYSA